MSESPPDGLTELEREHWVAHNKGEEVRSGPKELKANASTASLAPPIDPKTGEPIQPKPSNNSPLPAEEAAARLNQMYAEDKKPDPSKLKKPTGSPPQEAADRGSQDTEEEPEPTLQKQEEKQDYLAISEDDRINFLQSTLGGIPFAKSYNLMGGEMEMVFESPTLRESQAVNRIEYQFYRDNPDVQVSEGEKVRFRLHLLTSLKRFSCPTKVYEKPEEKKDITMENAQALEDELFADRPVSWARMAHSYLQSFHQLLLMLEVKSQDPNFFSEAASSD